MIIQLVDLIKTEEDVLERFLNCLNEQKESIISNKIDLFDETVQEQERLIRRIRELEASRVEMVGSIARVAGTDSDLTITRLIELNLGESSEELKSLKRTLSGLIEKIKKANRVNQYLLKRSLSFIQRNIDIFIDEADTSTVYLPNGSRQQRTASRLIVDKAI
jgi:flagellar biosynthesis/type III secretory pathway chaperone